MMVNNHYELILLGPGKDTRKDVLSAQVSELFSNIGLDFRKDGKLLIGGGAEPDWSGFPVAVWFGGDVTADTSELELMRQFLERGFTVFPVVESLSRYSNVVPPELKAINGQKWNPAKTAADIMKGFRLSRAIRQVFISYKRSESAGVAHQLFHELNERGYRVFLDTASVEAGVDFQKALWSRMADVDLVVLLDTKNALNSTWVHQELNRAHDLGMGVVQLIWPNHKQSPGTELSLPIQLKDVDFKKNFDADGTLQADTLEVVIRSIESERIRSLGARRTRLVEGLLEHVNAKGAMISIHPMKNVDVLRGAKKILEVVPFVGVPDSLALYQHELDKMHEPTIIVYNGLGVDPEWAEHLRWLNGKGAVTMHQIDDFGSYIGSIV